MSEPSAPPPEDRDWTYVITQGCTECGFAPFHHTLAAARLRETVPRWRAALAEASATARPAPLDTVSGDAWERRGIRSNGSQFTVATLAVYFLHDVEHHLHDVGA